jgi:hypothetical protein
LRHLSVADFKHSLLKLLLTRFLEIVAAAVHLRQTMGVAEYEFAFAFRAEHANFFLACEASLPIFLQILRLFRFGQLHLGGYAQFHKVFLELYRLAFLLFAHVSFSKMGEAVLEAGGTEVLLFGRAVEGLACNAERGLVFLGTGILDVH